MADGTPVRPSLSPSRRSYQTQVAAVEADDISVARAANAISSHAFDDITVAVADTPSRTALEKASLLLQRGETVAFPTETVYGLAADATNDDAVRRIFHAKSRPSDNPLIVHVASLAQLRRLLVGEPTTSNDAIPDVYMPLIARFWPGPLTILLKRGPNTPLSSYVTADQPTFAVRMPDNIIAQALCRLSDLPLAAPSANQSSKPSPTHAEHVLFDLKGRIPLILDGGPSSVGLESTVVNGLVDPPVILRPGGISVEQIRECGGVWERVVYGRTETDFAQGVPQAPGMKYKHYSPLASVVLYEAGSNPPTMTEILNSARGKPVGMLRTRTWRSTYPQEVNEYTQGAIQVYDRQLGTDGSDISRNLFAELRQMDQLDVGVIYVEGIVEREEGLAVMNRLRKAASIFVRKPKPGDR